MKFNLRIIGMALGPALFFLILIMPTPGNMLDPAKAVLAISVWMIIWWITESIPVYATALLPLGLIPVLGVLPVKDVASEYMHPIIVLLLGMFMIALAIEKSELHKKIALKAHHVVEAPDESGKARTIGLCHECHLKHERYRNYLQDECGVDIDRTSLAQE